MNDFGHNLELAYQKDHHAQHILPKTVKINHQGQGIKEKRSRTKQTQLHPLCKKQHFDFNRETS